MSKFCPKCHKELIGTYCYTCDKDMEEELLDEEKKEAELKRKREEDKIKKGRTFSDIAVLLFITSIPSIGGIGWLFSNADIKLVFAIASGFVFASSIIYIFSIKKENDKKVSTKTYNIIKGILIILSIVGVTAVLLNNNPIDNRDNRPRKYINCENRSDTYNKCSWSISEDRCVCERR